MKTVICDFLCFLWKRSSTNAACLIIGVAGYMTPAMMRDLGDYLIGRAEDLTK
jgi:hypothetical protein